MSQLLSVSPKGIPSTVTNMNMEHAVVLLVEEIRYKPEGRGLDSRLGHNPSDRTVALTSTKPLTKMSTRNISWEVKAARTCRFLESLKPQLFGNFKACPGLYRNCFTFTNSTNDDDDDDDNNNNNNLCIYKFK